MVQEIIFLYLAQNRWKGVKVQTRMNVSGVAVATSGTVRVGLWVAIDVVGTTEAASGGSGAATVIIDVDTWHVGWAGADVGTGRTGGCRCRCHDRTGRCRMRRWSVLAWRHALVDGVQTLSLLERGNLVSRRKTLQSYRNRNAGK